MIFEGKRRALGSWIPFAIFALALTAGGVGLAANRGESLAVQGPPLKGSDRGFGNYVNPVLFADYSDPDAVRVGEDYFLVSSSFSSLPGLPILHSKDLVHWTIIGHAVPRLSPDFDLPQHGKGLWAPSLRHHAGLFWIYVGDPDRGIFVTTAKDAAGPWSPLTLVKSALGAIDPCPLFDDDGRMYLVHAWAKSRAGFNSVLTVTPLTADGRRADGKDVQVFDGHERHPTIEGPKFYKRGGYYYIFAPAGGVPTGWQTVLRSKSILGPYEDRIVLRQGDTAVNGPHQGAWVETPRGESWFLHFQDRGAYGRVVHLQPMEWKNDWPLIGSDSDGDGVGEPVATFRKPVMGLALGSPQMSDEFHRRALGLQWQWNANPSPGWFSLSARPGWLRLFAAEKTQRVKSVFGIPNLLLQKFAAEEFVATARLDASALQPGERAGLVIAGRDSAAITAFRDPNGFGVEALSGKDVDKEGADQPGRRISLRRPEIWLRVRIERDPARSPAESSPAARFSYSTDGKHFEPLGEVFRVRPGVWVGARLGLFAYGPAKSSHRPGFVDIDWFRMEELK